MESLANISSFEGLMCGAGCVVSNAYGHNDVLKSRHPFLKTGLGLSAGALALAGLLKAANSSRDPVQYLPPKTRPAVERVVQGTNDFINVVPQRDAQMLRDELDQVNAKLKGKLAELTQERMAHRKTRRTFEAGNTMVGKWRKDTSERLDKALSECQELASERAELLQALSSAHEEVSSLVHENNALMMKLNKMGAELKDTKTAKDNWKSAAVNREASRMIDPVDLVKEAAPNAAKTYREWGNRAADAAQKVGGHAESYLNSPAAQVPHY